MPSILLGYLCLCFVLIISGGSLFLESPGFSLSPPLAISFQCLLKKMTNLWVIIFGSMLGSGV